MQSPARPQPAPSMVEASPPPPPQAQSRLRLEGALADRKLVAPIELSPQRHSDLLNPSIVQVVVNPEGQPILVPVLLSGSGSANADSMALQLARTARFNSVYQGGPEAAANPIAQLAWGRMIFEWQTLPTAVTNAVSTGP